MFKRAKVLKFFSPENCKNFSYDELYTLLKHFGLQRLEIRPQYSDEITSKIFNNVTHGTLFCVTENVKRDEEEFAFLCYPMQSKNFNIAVTEGESIWYFEDKTFSKTDLKTVPTPKFFWLATAPMSFTPFSSNKNIFKSSPNDISFLTSSLTLKNKTNINKFYSDKENLIIQNKNDSFISIENKFDIDKIKIFSGATSEDNSNFLNTENMDFDNVKSAILVSTSGIDFYDNLYFESLSDMINYKPDKEFLLNSKNIFSYENENFLTETLSSNSSDNIDKNIFKESSIFDYQNTPNVSLKSNIINIITKSAASDFVNNPELDEDDLLSDQNNETLNSQFHEIRLLKNGINLSDSSQILMNNDAEISLDGKNIYAGNFNRHLIKHQIVNEEEIFDTLKNNRDVFNSLDEEKKQKVLNMCGKGDSFLIGYEKSLSEPLVLGNTLSVLLKDMIELLQMTIDQNRVLNDKVNALAQEYTTHIHPTAPEAVTVTVVTPAGVPFPAAPTGVGLTVPLPTQPTTNLASHQAFSTTDTVNIDTDLNDIQSKLEEVKSNLKYMLSRFAKTSWRYTYLIKEKYRYVEFR